jgi:hypothetical protein
VTDLHGVDGLGTPVTLVKLNPEDGEITPEGADPLRVAEAIVAGRAQISLGAWAQIDVEGAGLGELASATLNADGEGSSARINLKVQALPEIDVRWIYLLVNCDLVHTWEASDPEGLVKLDTEYTLEVSEDAWVTVVAFGDEPMPAGLKDYNAQRVPRLVTNAIYIDADLDGEWSHPGGKRCDIPVGRW